MTYSLSHVTDELLVRIARGEALDHDTDGEVAHLDECTTCEARLLELSTMIALFERQQSAVAMPSILAGALQRRAQHERVILSHESRDSTNGRPDAARSRYGVSIAVAALVVIAAVAMWTRNRAPSSVALDANSRSRNVRPAPPVSTENALGALSPWPLVAYAQSASEVPELPYPAITAFDTTAVKNGTRRYVRSSASSYHDYMPIDAEVIELRDTTYKGVRVWRVVTSSPLMSTNVVRADTAWIRRSDMRLIARRNESVTGSVRQQLLSGDTVLQQTTVVNLPEKMKVKMNPAHLRFSSMTPIRPGHLLVTDRSYFHLLIRSLPLHATWRGSIDINLGRTRNLTPAIYDQTRSINVSVQGDSVVSTLWGYVPSWRVVVHTGPNPERWYVSKEGHEVLLVTGPFATEWPRNRFDLIGRYVK